VGRVSGAARYAFLAPQDFSRAWQHDPRFCILVQEAAKRLRNSDNTSAPRTSTKSGPPHSGNRPCHGQQVRVSKSAAQCRYSLSLYLPERLPTAYATANPPSESSFAEQHGSNGANDRLRPRTDSSEKHVQSRDASTLSVGAPPLLLCNTPGKEQCFGMSFDSEISATDHFRVS
jgi:hypothetical protein